VILAGGAAYQLSGLGRWGGPLAVGFFREDGGASAGFIAPTGPIVSGGAVTWIRNDGHLTATLDGLELVAPRPGVQLVGAYLRGCRTERCIVGAGEVLRPDDSRLRRLAGVRLPPHPADGWDLAVIPALRISRPGLYPMAGYFVRYSVGAMHYRVFMPGQADLCAIPAGAHRWNCG
jgi:hypothetical protein